MKRRFIQPLAALAALAATSCNNFLDEVPDNRTELDTDDKITQILTSAYPDNTYAVWTNLMGDDQDDIGTGYGVYSNYEDYMVSAWNWREIKESGNDSPDQTWGAFYGAIANANQSLAAIDKLGNPERLSAQRGEGLIARAWCHFKLVNLFCQHYTEANGGSDMGIPYIDRPETEVRPQYSRGTVAEVYEKIARDIEEGLPLIDDDIYTVPKYHFNRSAAYAFAAEFYLFYKKYDRAIECANVVLGSNPEAIMRDVTGWADMSKMPITGDTRPNAYINPNVDANLLLMTSVSLLGPFTDNTYYGARFGHTTNIMRTETLASPSILWNLNSNQNTFYMPVVVFTHSTFRAIRHNIPNEFEITNPAMQTGYPRTVLPIYTVENALLVRAEANVLKENYAAAMADINLWIKKRVNPQYGNASPKTEQQVEDYYGGTLPFYTYDNPTPRKKMAPETPFASAKQEAFIQALMHIRRVEFFQEGNRWFDIKRYNIEIVRRQHRDPPFSVTLQDVLAPRDLRMAVQLPVSVISAGLPANPRP